MSDWVSVEGGNLPPKPHNGVWERYIVAVVITYNSSIFDEPEENALVMTAFYDHNQKIWHLDNDMQINALRESSDSPLCGDYVTHWMPMPKLPG